MKPELHWTAIRQRINAPEDVLLLCDQHVPPIDPVALAKEMGIAVYRRDMTKKRHWGGFTYDPQAQTGRILVCKSLTSHLKEGETSVSTKMKEELGGNQDGLGGDNKHRWRFIVTHELAHFLIDDPLLGCPKSKTVSGQNGKIIEHRDSPNNFANPSDRREQRANQFAADLLMPSVMFLQVVHQIQKSHRFRATDSQVIKGLSEVFEVSPTVAKVRFYELIDPSLR